MHINPKSITPTFLCPDTLGYVFHSFIVWAFENLLKSFVEHGTRVCVQLGPILCEHRGL